MPIELTDRERALLRMALNELIRHPETYAGAATKEELSAMLDRIPMWYNGRCIDG